MPHFPIAVILPKDVFDAGYQNIVTYIANLIKPYDENIDVAPYVKITKDALDKEYNEYAENEEPQYIYSKEEYCEKVYGCELDEAGNGISTFNENSILDEYIIGGRYFEHGYGPGYKYNNKDKLYTREDFETRPLPSCSRSWACIANTSRRTIIRSSVSEGWRARVSV